jgi:TolB-like protein/tetratricopeptide (TPR) repeat protein
VFVANAGRIREHAGRSTRIGGMSESGAPGTATGPEPAAPQGPSASCDVFISYASQDAAVANAIVAAMERQRLKCWIAPRDVIPGSLYADGIVRAISGAKVFALVLSEQAIASSHVGKEIERASSNRRPIIALRIDLAPLTPAFQYFLSESQWIDVGPGGMDAASAKLVEAAQRHLTPRSATEQVSAPDRHPLTSKSPTPQKSWIGAAAVAVVVVALAYFVINKFWLSNKAASERPVAAVARDAAPGTPAISDKSIAVLPFMDMSEKKDQEYFADGMAEEILDLLAKIPGLTVIGRTSSFQFKGKNADLRTIGTQLNAAYILEGSVRKSGEQVRITAQLINARTGTHEWSETYDRRIGDVLKLQDAIAAAVVRELQLTVAPGYLNSRSTVKNADAYDLMLRGRHAADRYDKEGLDEAVTLFQQALDRDPTSADAAVGLAWAYETQGEFGFLAPAAAFEQARRAAATALKLDPKSAEAHAVLGQIHVVYDWDWAAAEREFQQAATLAPGSADVLSGEATLSLALGRWDDALRQIKAALAQDPLDAGSLNYLSDIQERRGHLPEADAARRRAREIRPNSAWGHYYLGRIMLARGDHDAALAEIQQETVDEGKQPGLAMVYYALGRKTDSDAALARMLKEQADGNAFGIAEVYAFRGQSDEAMHWLERAYAQKDAGLYYIKGDLPLKNLEADPRFKAFLRKMNLPD